MTMKAILVKPKFGGKPHILGPFTEDEAQKKLDALNGKKVVVSMDFPKPVATAEYSTFDVPA